MVLIVAFVLASVATAWAPSAGTFIAGRVAQGPATSMMLIAAVPPLVVGWPKRRRRTTAMTMNLAVFGAVALGPVVGRGRRRPGNVADALLDRRRLRRLGVAAFVAGPLLLHMSETVGATPAAGIESAVRVAFGIALVGAVIAWAVWVAGGARPQRPDIQTRLEGDGPAIETTPLGGSRR